MLILKYVSGNICLRIPNDILSHLLRYSGISDKSIDSPKFILINNAAFFAVVYIVFFKTLAFFATASTWMTVSCTEIFRAPLPIRATTSTWQIVQREGIVI